MDLFEEYVKNYDFNDDDISYKYKHTLRVQELCQLIANALGLNDHEIYIAGLCGLFHDIGRFEQDKRFNSFQDTKAFDHGDFGYEIFLREFAEKLNLNEEETLIIAKSILYHNKFEIGECSEKEKMYCQITRDADKIDILYVLANGIRKINQSNGELSIKCHDDFMSHRSVNFADVISDVDKNLLTLSYIWDINFDISYKIIKDNKYFNKIEKILNNEIYNKYFEEIRNFMKEK